MTTNFHHFLVAMGGKIYQLAADGHSLSAIVSMVQEWARSQGQEVGLDDILNIAQDQIRRQTQDSMSQMSQESQRVTGCHNESQSASQDVTTSHGGVTARNIAGDVREWVLEHPGTFTGALMKQELGFTNQEYAAARQALVRLEKTGEVRKVRGKRGVYRAVDTSTDDIMDICGAASGEVPIGFPLDIHNLVSIHEKDIILVAGEPNAGKTAFAMNTVWSCIKASGMSQKSQESQSPIYNRESNINTLSINYFSSEAGPSEIKGRIKRFGPSTPLKGMDVVQAFAQHCQFRERNHNFADHVDPTGINVIDFLEVFDGEYYKIGGDITEIHGALSTGVGMICVQQAQGSALPRGGSTALEKPRLAVSLSEDKERGFCTCKILKAKHFKGRNPNGLERDYIIRDGVFFCPLSEWDYKKNLESKRKSPGYVERVLNFHGKTEAA